MMNANKVNELFRSEELIKKNESVAKPDACVNWKEWLEDDSHWETVADYLDDDGGLTVGFKKQALILPDNSRTSWTRVLLSVDGEAWQLYRHDACKPYRDAFGMWWDAGWTAWNLAVDEEMK